MQKKSFFRGQKVKHLFLTLKHLRCQWTYFWLKKPLLSVVEGERVDENDCNVTVEEEAHVKQMALDDTSMRLKRHQVSLKFNTSSYKPQHKSTITTSLDTSIGKSLRIPKETYFLERLKETRVVFVSHFDHCSWSTIINGVEVDHLPVHFCPVINARQWSHWTRLWLTAKIRDRQKNRSLSFIQSTDSFEALGFTLP